MSQIVGVAATVVLLTALSAGTATSRDVLPQAQQLDQVVTTVLEEYKIPGAAIGIWTPRGEWKLFTGLADVSTTRPVTPSTYFGIRSITKSFTVTLVLQLVAGSHGAIDLDDQVVKFVNDVPNGWNITLRQLANMTSGLYDYTADPMFRQAFVADLTRSWTPDELLDFALHSPSHPPANFSPGARYQYSNTNTLLLGKVVEAWTGQPFARVLSAQILRPLKLRSTAFVTGTDLPNPAALGYHGSNADGSPDQVIVNATSLSFAGAMASSLYDLANWGVALASGTLLPPALQQERFVARSTSDDPASPVYDRYGVGIGEVAGWWGHTGEGAGFEAAVFHQIDQDETFAVLLNATDRHDVPVAIFCRVLEVLHESPPTGSSPACEGGSRNGSSPTKE